MTLAADLAGRCNVLDGADLGVDGVVEYGGIAAGRRPFVAIAL